VIVETSLSKGGAVEVWEAGATTLVYGHRRVVGRAPREVRHGRLERYLLLGIVKSPFVLDDLV